jgi:hypothetical protein
MKKNLALALAFAVLATTAAAQETKKKEEKKMSGNPVVVVKTSLGTFKAEIYSDKAPVSAKNFLQYVSDKYYDGTVWHRVIPTFMIRAAARQGPRQEKPAPHRERGFQRPLEHGRDAGHGSHERSNQRDFASSS